MCLFCSDSRNVALLIPPAPVTLSSGRERRDTHNLELYNMVGKDLLSRWRSSQQQKNTDTRENRWCVLQHTSQTSENQVKLYEDARETTTRWIRQLRERSRCPMLTSTLSVPHGLKDAHLARQINQYKNKNRHSYVAHLSITDSRTS